MHTTSTNQDQGDTASQDASQDASQEHFTSASVGYGKSIPQASSIDDLFSTFPNSDVKGIVHRASSRDLILIERLKSISLPVETELSSRNRQYFSLPFNSKMQNTNISNALALLKIKDRELKNLFREKLLRDYHDFEMISLLKDDAYKPSAEQLITIFKLVFQNSLQTNSVVHVHPSARANMCNSLRGATTIIYPDGISKNSASIDGLGERLFFKGGTGWDKEKMLEHSSPSVRAGSCTADGRIVCVFYSMEATPNNIKYVLKNSSAIKRSY